MKRIVTFPLNTTISSLNYLQDKISRQKKTETHDNVKIQEELKEEKMSFDELVTSKGYPLEIHYCTTEDGFILKVFRIPGGKGEKSHKLKQKQSVLIMHGIYDSSDCWVCNSEDKCIPFILANLGYDVWLGNSRGNKHSRYHKIYHPDAPEFWDYSFHEMGKYDLPSMLNHIIAINTWSTKLIYIGHSQGTSQLLSAMSYNNDYLKTKIKLFIALGPVAKIQHMTSKLLKLMRAFRIDKLLSNLKFNEILYSDDKLQKMQTWLTPKMPSLTAFAMNLLMDVNSGTSNNSSRMSVYMSHLPGGGSMKAVAHFVQLYRSHKFEYFDYGKENNIKTYGQPEPPIYDLKGNSGDIPTCLIYGTEDKISNQKDTEWIRDQLGDNCIMCKGVEFVGHSGFIMANDMKWFDEIIEMMDLYL